MTPAERAFAEARAQGLPAVVEDPATLARIARIVATDRKETPRASAA